jgi:hypothetical protein
MDRRPRPSAEVCMLDNGRRPVMGAQKLLKFIMITSALTGLVYLVLGVLALGGFGSGSDRSRFTYAVCFLTMAMFFWLLRRASQPK